MCKEPEPPIRIISILVGIMIGCVLAYAYHVNLPIFSSDAPFWFSGMFLWTGLVVFLTIPVLAGFVSALLHPTLAMRNGLYVGFFTGLFNSILGAIKLIYTVSPLEPATVNAFSLFAIVSIFTWTMISAAGALLGPKFYE